eukprot:CAMPEP_0202892790 /NCGR_PEP_ID=MMETSP1392-20130828/2485_1 /ASSEMBLY_ACC=CAM_ASM_000868 /TAXON_ID=225041 /ORGANISM="Chlamydomonas chlamydogama, Strain SAG 11-48b" /LENGTH=188 /DNA_ID=CAMNT_0049576877 /DNA_START=359 /DNA_END=925 /DNA_ORIENTATION=+
MADERLNLFFDGVSMDAQTGMPAKNSAFMCHILGNAAAFDRNYRGMTPHQYMRKYHIRLIRNLGFSPAHFDMGVEHLIAACQAGHMTKPLIDEMIAVVAKTKALIFEPAPGEEEFWSRTVASAEAGAASAHRHNRSGHVGGVAVAEGTLKLPPGHPAGDSSEARSSGCPAAAMTGPGANHAQLCVKGQ